MNGSLRLLLRLRRGSSLRIPSYPSSASASPLPLDGPSLPDKISRIVDSIAELNLLEVSELNSALKSRLNISDAPAVMMGGNGAAPAPVKEEEEEEGGASPVAVQTSFTLKVLSFDPPKKIALIKELKAQVDDMNLVQAKKFVESAPAILKQDISKDEAEKIKQALESVGATCEIL